MFDVGASELLLIVVVAIVVIGPKDIPLAMRTAGRWIGKLRRVSNHFRAGIETMIREAEMEEMEKKWREQNQKIMEENPPVQPDMQAAPQAGDTPAASAEARATPSAAIPVPASPPLDTEPLAAPRQAAAPQPGKKPEEPQLPLGGSSPSS